jgi:hypothetical protein
MEIGTGKSRRSTLAIWKWMCCTATVFFGCMAMAVVPAAGSESSPVIHPAQGLSASGPAEIYHPDSLYEKINGQAEMYLASGFVELKSQWFEWVDDTGKIIEMNVYNMGSLLNAFSVYSQQRRQDATQLSMAPFAHQTQSAVFLVHGPFYVEILPSEYATAMTDLAKQLAEKFITTNRVQDVYIKELDYFPPENLLAGRITIISKNAFGMNRLDNVFMGMYTLDGVQLTAYISDRESPSAAEQLAKAVYEHFMGFDGADVKPHVDIAGARMVAVMDNYELIFTFGTYLVGVHEAGTRKHAERMGERMHTYLMERLK